MQKKIGKLGQWTKEMLGREQRTQTTDEFKELEQEMQMRHEGVESLYNSISQWVKSMFNRREERKQTLIDSFGQALLNFGEKFSSESVYGKGLLKYGMAHKEISKEQEQLINGISNNILESMERALVQFKDYQTARKKLESRRLSYDSVSNRFPKAKKEDSRIEEELRAAKAKYEEACENIYSRIYSIQQAEATQLNDLTVLLELEFKYYERCYMIIQNLKESWEEINNAYETNSKYVKHRQTAAHAFNNGGENSMNRPSLPFRPGVNTSSLERKISEMDLNSSKQTCSFKPTPTKIAPESPHSIEHENRQDTESLKLEHSFKTDEQDTSILSNGNTPVIPPRAYEKNNGKDNMSSTKRYSTLKNPSVKNHYNTYQDISEENSLSFDENRDLYLENHSSEFLNRFSYSDGSASKSYSSLKFTPEIKTLESPIVKTRKPPIPPQFLQTTGSNNLNNTCKNCDCDDYQENLFKKGQCNQCFHAH